MLALSLDYCLVTTNALTPQSSLNLVEDVHPLAKVRTVLQSRVPGMSVVTMAGAKCIHALEDSGFPPMVPPVSRIRLWFPQS